MSYALPTCPRKPIFTYTLFFPSLNSNVYHLLSSIQTGMPEYRCFHHLRFCWKVFYHITIFMHVLIYKCHRIISIYRLLSARITFNRCTFLSFDSFLCYVVVMIMWQYMKWINVQREIITYYHYHHSKERKQEN